MKKSPKAAKSADFIAVIKRAIPFHERYRFATEQQIAQSRLDEALNEALMDSFPASDPISSLRPT